jgi:hypothetical protein
MRYCPKDLEGTGWTLGCSAFNLAWLVLDPFASAPYEHSGLGLWVMISTAATILSLVIRLVPRRAIDIKESQA